MGREIRNVPENWVHPKDKYGEYKPVFDQTYKEAAEKWIKGFYEFESKTEEEKNGYKYYWEYDNPPDESYYRPEFDSKPNCFQIYETVTEGTPVSPVFKTKQEIVDWLISEGYAKKMVEKFVETGWAMSGVFSKKNPYYMTLNKEEQK